AGSASARRTPNGPLTGRGAGEGGLRHGDDRHRSRGHGCLPCELGNGPAVRQLLRCPHRPRRGRHSRGRVTPRGTLLFADLLRTRCAEPTLADFGAPMSATDYRLCVYDHLAASPTLVLEAAVPSGGTCTGKPCWRRRRGPPLQEQRTTPPTASPGLTSGLAG